MRKKQGKKPTAAEKQAAAFDDADDAEQEAAYTEKDLKVPASTESYCMHCELFAKLTLLLKLI